MRPQATSNYEVTDEYIRLTKSGGKAAEGRRDWLMSADMVDCGRTEPPAADVDVGT